MMRSKDNRKRFSGPNSVQLLQSGDLYFQRLETLLKSAKFEIHLQTYIFEADETGLKLISELKKAAERGVQVYLLLDAFGSAGLSGAIIAELKNCGVQLRFFGRLFSRGKFHLGRRLHRKVIVVDGITAVVGGINIGNRYNEINGKKPWLDFALELTGITARRLRRICRQRWIYSGNKKYVTNLRLPSAVNHASEQNSISLAISENDFLRRKSEIAISYRNAIRQSKKEIILVGAYFMPGIRVRRLLKKAKRRGVEIHCIFGAASDVMLSVYAREFLYQWMLRHGIKIYEYTPSNVHGKVLICDRHWMSIGSFDLNSLSTYSNIELNLEIDDEKFVGDVRQQLLSIQRKDCIEVTHTTYQVRSSILRQLKCWIAFQLTKTLFGLAYILSKGTPRRD